MVRRNALMVILVVGVLGATAIGGGLLLFDGGTGTGTSTSCGSTSCSGETSTTATTTSTTIITYSTTRTTTTITTLTSTTNTTTTSTGSTTTSTCCNASKPRLGFWLQESDIMQHYSASEFFNAMFLKPPYPSSMEMMTFSILQAQKGQQGCNTGSGYIGDSLNYWGQVAQMANSYPKIRLIFEIAFNSTSATYGLGCFTTVVRGLAQYASVYGIGVEGEYTHGITEPQMQAALSDISQTGKSFITYFPEVPVPPGGYQIYHTNFPMQGAQVGTLANANSQTSQTVGISSGYYDDFPFPSTFICPIGPTAVANGALTNEPQGYDQCVVSTELGTAVSLPASERQFVEFVPGFSSSGSFIGVSGLSTNQLWDNPTLRNWIWSDPNYQGKLILSMP